MARVARQIAACLCCLQHKAPCEMYNTAVRIQLAVPDAYMSAQPSKLHSHGLSRRPWPSWQQNLAASAMYTIDVLSVHLCSVASFKTESTVFAAVPGDIISLVLSKVLTDLPLLKLILPSFLQNVQGASIQLADSHGFVPFSFGQQSLARTAAPLLLTVSWALQSLHMLPGI
ncbi:TPA: hypothetical protein ACH3X1_016263 [Trebouxia sp. C0004]